MSGKETSTDPVEAVLLTDRSFYPDSCDGCGDVVKKPKLDQHRSRCGAPFTCLDCSIQFYTPADYKGHTSCISEAEKYQKVSERDLVFCALEM